jgi:DNA anti-recombination protein RmuC
MLGSSELEAAFRCAAVRFTELLARCSGESDRAEVENYRAALATAGDVLERSTSAVSVTLAQHRTESATQQYLNWCEAMARRGEKESRDSVDLLAEAVLELRNSNDGFAGQVLERSDRL